MLLVNRPFHSFVMGFMIMILINIHANTLRTPRSSRNGITELIAVPSKHLPALTTDSQWENYLREVPVISLPQSSSGSILSPALQYELHRKVASEPVGLAERRHTIAISEDGNIHFAKSMVQHKLNTWYLSDLSVALETAVQVPLVFDCRPFYTNTSTTMLRLTAYRSIGQRNSQTLLDERTELFNVHSDHAQKIHQGTTFTVTDSSVPSYPELLSSTLELHTPTEGTTIFFDKLASYSNCPTEGAFVINEGIMDTLKGHIDFQLSSVSLFSDAYAAADIRFGNDNQPNDDNIFDIHSYNPWWKHDIGLSPEDVLSMVEVDSGALNCKNNGDDDAGCNYNINDFPVGNMNYNPSTKRASQPISFTTGVDCTNCWSSLTLSMAVSIKFCVNFVSVGITKYIGSNQCNTAATVPDCKSNGGCGFYMNVTLVGSGNFETNIEVSAGNIPPNSQNKTNYDFTRVTLTPIPIPGLEAINAKLNPGFVLGSQIQVSGASSYGFNGTAGWNVNAQVSNAKLGVQFYAYLLNLPSIITPSAWKTGAIPIYAFTPKLNVPPPFLSRLAIGDMIAQLALMPNLLLNITMGYSTTSFSLTAIAPFIITPNIYIQLQTGVMNSTTPPTGVTPCLGNGGWDTWYALMYGSNLILKWEGFSLTGVLPSPGGSGTYSIIDPQPAVIYPMLNPALLPASSKPFGCVSSTWPQAPKPEEITATSNAPIAAIVGGVVGAIVVLGAMGAVVIYRPTFIPFNIGGENGIPSITKSVPQQNPLRSHSTHSSSVNNGGISLTMVNGLRSGPGTQFKIRDIMPPPNYYYTRRYPKQ